MDILFPPTPASMVPAIFKYPSTDIGVRSVIVLNAVTLKLWKDFPKPTHPELILFDPDHPTNSPDFHRTVALLFQLTEERYI